MKLIIQIPCFNESEHLSAVIQALPKKITGIDSIEYQVIDDSSTDATAEVAKNLGVHHILRIKGKNRRWLGRAFKIGIDHALLNGADIVVNTDADNQYPAELIPELITPILEESADIVIGDRHPEKIKEFSTIKRFLQGIGCRIVSFLLREPVPDAVSGFRAYSREALFKLNFFINYTYTIDTLMQAHLKGLAVCWIPISTNPPRRDSRLISSLFSMVARSASAILLLTCIYEPLKTFLTLSVICAVPALFYLLRFFYFYFVVGSGAGHIQSLVISGALLVIAAQLLIFGLLGNLLAVNRRLVEDLLERVRKIELEKQAK